MNCLTGQIELRFGLNQSVRYNVEESGVTDLTHSINV